ncbi:MAG: S41 family peptidase [Pseudomonadota bacterium]
MLFFFNNLKTSTLLGLVLLAGCGGADTPLAEGLDSALINNQCSVQGQNQFVFQVMQDVYYWNTELPMVDPNTFDSPESLLESLRFRPLDNTFSTIRDAVTQSQFFSEGQTIGLGVTLVFDQFSALRIAEVVAGSPAQSGGLSRGDEILAIDGIAIADVIAGAGIGAALGADEVGVPVQLTVRNLSGLEAVINLEKALITIESVPVTAVFDVNGITVGYLNFKTFITPAFDDLDAAFASFRDANVQELILDIRYNGGGFVSVAEFLGNLVGGANTDGQVFSNRVFNANNAARNVTSFFADEDNALDLTRLFVLTTGRTASASEIVINSLLPYVDVVTIGGATFGKPVGSIGFNFCDKTLNPISFSTRNANDEGDYFDGIPVDCAVADDLSRPLGDPAEASIAVATNYIQTNTCTSSTKAGVEIPKLSSSDSLRSLHWVY